MAKQRRFRMLRSVKLVPAAMVSAIVLAVMSLLGLLNFDIGMPSLSVDGVATDAPPDTSDDESPKDERLTVADAPEGADGGVAAGESEGSAESMNPAGAIDVLIDGEEYRVELRGRDGEVTRETRSLAEIVELARASSGDGAGIRVRISRRFNAVQRADRALRDALSEAGVGQDEIDHRRTLVD